MRLELLEPRRVRHPRGAYGWVDLRVVTGGFLERLDPAVALTYLFLCAVGNMLGLSFWGIRRMGGVLHLDGATVKQALETLVAAGLIAWNGRVVQVLPLPEAPVPRADQPPACHQGDSSRREAAPSETATPVVKGGTPAKVREFEAEAREHLRRFLGRRGPSESVVRAVAKGLALEAASHEQTDQGAGHGRGRA